MWSERLAKFSNRQGVREREGKNNYHGISVTLARTFSELAKHRGVRERERERERHVRHLE